MGTSSYFAQEGRKEGRKDEIRKRVKKGEMQG